MKEPTVIMTIINPSDGNTDQCILQLKIKECDASDVDFMIHGFITAHLNMLFGESRPIDEKLCLDYVKHLVNKYESDFELEDMEVQ